MNFRKKVKQDDLEINFIPLIDVLLVIIIFLVVSTTFSKFSELKINLPTAEANQVDKNVERERGKKERKRKKESKRRGGGRREKEAKRKEGEREKIRER